MTPSQWGEKVNFVVIEDGVVYPEETACGSEIQHRSADSGIYQLACSISSVRFLMVDNALVVSCHFCWFYLLFIPVRQKRDLKT